MTSTANVTSTLKTKPLPLLTLNAKTAADLMTPNPVSISDGANLQEAITVLTGGGFSAAPVLDKTGRPVGVVSQSDILVHDREKIEFVSPVPEYYAKSDLTTAPGAVLNGGFQGHKADSAQVRDIMTPVVFSVRPDAPPQRVVEDMVGWKVHRLFVVDESGALVGVISALDVLRHLG